MEELGDRNPHRTLKGVLVTPCIEAFKSLRPRTTDVDAPLPTASPGTTTTA